MGPWCCDLDETITATPQLLQVLLRGLKDAGHEVHIVSGTHHSPATREDLEAKQQLLAQCGMVQGTHYDKLVAVSGPEKKVAANKVNYMTHIGATGLIDNSGRNIKKAVKAGFLGLHYKAPK